MRMNADVDLGACVTFVCRGPPGDHIFRLEKEGEPLHTVKSNSGTAAEARFFITSVNKDSGGHYRCLYYTGDVWSERSELVELMVTDEELPRVPTLLRLSSRVCLSPGPRSCPQLYQGYRNTPAFFPDLVSYASWFSLSSAHIFILPSDITGLPGHLDLL
ncbi:PREDICTED: leukocyte-associated immunoglobulin-like receptor 1 [Chrysochloris asiatica]|uniref:Leukocyte-associated immunoglobulin-like receptor 1 n=1 Tax=Chrysochloris asiatica TaxID=185453 RepID=A0A9B0TN39_CHRAS|nr:PREDICTED: leukocyte-associated immunoglobulin-like receptor 1 [Chrysochloris asiatica]